MKATLKTTILLCACLLVLGGCAEEKSKVDLPAQASEKTAGDESTKDKEIAKEQSGEPTSESTSEPASEPAPTARKSAGRRFSATFEPQRTAGVAANVGGIIREVYVDEGDVVEAGDRLVNIDAQDYRLRVEQAQAAVAAAKAQVDTIETEVDRTTGLLEKQAAPQAQLDQLTGNLAAAKAQLAQAKVGLRMAQKARGDAIITAPYDGVITAVNVAEGEFAAPGPSPLVQLDEVQHLYLRVVIPEEYTASVDKGDALEVRVPALAKTMNLVVARINPIVSEHSRSFDVLAEVDNPALEVRPGMFAEVTVAGSQTAGADSAQQADRGEQ